MEELFRAPLELPTRTDPQLKHRVRARRASVHVCAFDGLMLLGSAHQRVDVVDAYRTIPVEPTDAERERIIGADIVTFTSSSTVENWVAAFGIETLPNVVACIGPITADTARRAGLRVDVIADVHTIDGLVDALIDRAAHPTAPKKATTRRSSRGPRFGRQQRRA